MPPTPRPALSALGIAAALLLASAAVAVKTVGAQDVPPVPTRWPYPVQTAWAEWTAVAATERAVELATYFATTYTPTLTVTSTPTMGATLTVTATPTDAATPVLFPCRFTPTRCGTRLFAPFSGKGRRR